MAGEAVNVSVATKPIKINVCGVGGVGWGWAGDGVKAESVQCHISSVTLRRIVLVSVCACVHVLSRSLSRAAY